MFQLDGSKRCPFLCNMCLSHPIPNDIDLSLGESIVFYSTPFTWLPLKVNAHEIGSVRELYVFAESSPANWFLIIRSN